MQWERIFEGITVALASALIIFVIRLFLPDGYKKRIQKTLWRIIKYLL